jgi:hypothetical protein
MVTPQVVCFCDIPLPDLPLHMTKYSRFGIAFRREFLISFGANPVFYVANNATVAVTTVELLTHLSDRTKQAAADGKFDRGLYFDINIKVLFDILWILDSLAHDYQGDWFKSTDPRDVERATVLNAMKHLFALTENETDLASAVASSRQRCAATIKNMSEFLTIGMLDFLKCFDAAKAEDDPNNFYMEREWRVPQNIHFTLSDVERVIMPRYFAKDFRRELPQYIGQITFAE